MEITRLRVETLDYKVGEDGVAHIEQMVNQIGEHSFVYRYCVFFENGESYSVNINHPYCEVWKSAPKNIPTMESFMDFMKSEQNNND